MAKKKIFDCSHLTDLNFEKQGKGYLLYKMNTDSDF